MQSFPYGVHSFVTRGRNIQGSGVGAGTVGSGVGSGGTVVGVGSGGAVVGVGSGVGDGVIVGVAVGGGQLPGSATALPVISPSADRFGDVMTKVVEMTLPAPTLL